jgi:pimeloyl-ACP methyl ester carboxylesterase
MRIIKTAFIAVFACFAVSSFSAAAELNSLNAASVNELTADLAVPAPQPAPVRQALERANGLDPAIVTVSGLSFGKIGWGPFELSHFISLYHTFFPAKKLSDEDFANALVSFNGNYFSAGNDNDVSDLAAASDSGSRLPDNYLEARLRDISGHDLVIVPFAWSRDPGDTEKTVPQLAAKIIEAYDANRNSGRPFYILAHSWGSVLAYEALLKVAAERPDVKVDKLITAGSPLLPANFVVKLFMKVEIYKEHLQKTVAKPANVKVWHNLWAKRDPYSNDIPVADANYQVDASVANLEPTLIDLILHNKLLRKDAKRDLFKIRDIKAWHGSYFYDYKAELVSVHENIYVPIFVPFMEPQVVAAAKAAQAAGSGN